LNFQPFTHPSTPAATWLSSNNLRDEGAFLTPNGFLMWRDKIVKSLRIARRPETIGCNGRQKSDPE